MDCVENCGHNNLSLLRVVAWVFSLKSTPQHLWVMWVYIVWLGTWCIRYDKLAKQNVSQVSRGKALPARHSQKPAIMTLRIPFICWSHASLHGKASRELLAKTFLIFTLPWVSTHSLSLTTLTMKSHMKYRVHKIEHNYNQIWHEIKTNIK